MKKYRVGVRRIEGGYEEVVCRRVAGNLHLEIRGDEQRCIMSYMTMQNGQVDLAIIHSSLDGPMAARVYVAALTSSSKLPLKDRQTYIKSIRVSKDLPVSETIELLVKMALTSIFSSQNKLRLTNKSLCFLARRCTKILDSLEE